MNDLLQDFRLALRSFVVHPTVTVLACVSLALAIGGNTTAFSLLSAVLLRPLPYPDPGRLVTVWQTDKENQGFDLIPVSPANFVDWQERARSFEDMAALQETALNLTSGDRREPMKGVSVSVNLFDVIGVAPVLGRGFLPEDGVEGDHRVVILSHETWQNRFAAAASIVGASLELQGEPYRVIGVFDEEFELLDPRFALWVPLTFPPGELPRDRRTLGVFARLRPDVTLDEARQEMRVIAGSLEEEYPEPNDGTSATVLTLHEQMAYGGGEQILVLLQGALFFVLLIAASNLANLLLARGQHRQREVALRAALGATRRRLAQQFFIESMVLALVGGLLGLLVGAWGIDFMAATFAAEFPKSFLPRMDASVVGFTLAIAVVAGVAFGFAPALRVSRANLSGAFRQGGAGTLSGRRFLSKGLVVAELALALVLLTGVGLFVRSVRHWRELDAGVRMENLLTLQIGLPDSGYAEEPDVSEFGRELLASVEALPGVTAATLADHLPRSPFPPRGAFSIDGEELPSATTLLVSSGYLRTMGIPLLRGRSFETADRWDSAPVVMINDAMERIHFPARDAIGRRITIRGASREVIGVVANVREDLFRDIRTDSEPILYLPAAQAPSRHMALVVQTLHEPGNASGPVRDALLALDRNLSVSEILTMEEFVAQFFVGVSAINGLLFAFGALAVLLAAVGIYGVIAFSVSRRTHEVGLRMALGARRSDVIRLVVREGLILALIGFGIGLPGVLVITRAVGSTLAGIVEVSPSATIGIACALFTVAMAASYIPARRASRLDPVVALRHD